MMPVVMAIVGHVGKLRVAESQSPVPANGIADTKTAAKMTRSSSDRRRAATSPATIAANHPAAISSTGISATR